MKKNKLVLPVLKWVGGKRQLLPYITKYIPKYTTYYEPFIGGGALLFELQPNKAVINDINEELINVYINIRDNYNELIEELKKYKNDEESYYQIRELDRDKEKYSNLSSIQKAARIIFLNKTCYNGLFRVNQSGEFNSPFGGYKNPNITNEITLKAVSNYLNNSEIKFSCDDFETVLNNIKKDSFVYLDPPYDPISNSSNFTGYSKGGFDRNEQMRLKKKCDFLHSQGVKFLLSNSSTDFIRDLYKDYIIETIPAKRIINSNSDKRGEVDEILVRNYEL